MDTSAKPTLVLGASERTDRYSNIAINSLVTHGHKVYAIGAKPGSAAGVEWSNEQIQWPEDIDTITLYLNPNNQKPYYDYILSLNPRRVIFNPGTENPELIQMLNERSIEPVIACTLVMLSVGNY